MDTQIQNIVVGVALVGLFLIFGISAIGSTETSLPIPDEQPREDLVDLTQGSIFMSRTFSNGTHIYAGIVPLPTPCHGVTTEVTIAESFPEQVGIHLMTTTSDAVCAQVITPRLFTVEFSADERAAVRVYLDGQPVVVELVEELPPLE